MSQYESLDILKHKYPLLWKKSKRNKNKLKEVPIITLNFNSINFNKKIITIPILTNKIESILPLKKIQTILLENFPEDMLNMTEPTVIYSVNEGFTSQFANGNTYVTHQDYRYWFNRIDKKHFNLKIFYSIRIRSEGVVIPVTVNMFLKIYNQKAYETRN